MSWDGNCCKFVPQSCNILWGFPAFGKSWHYRDLSYGAAAGLPISPSSPPLFDWSKCESHLIYPINKVLPSVLKKVTMPLAISSLTSTRIRISLWDHFFIRKWEKRSCWSLIISGTGFKENLQSTVFESKKEKLNLLGRFQWNVI